MNKKVNDYLEHYGILGMKWGKRKASRTRIAEAKERAASKRSEDYTQSRSLKRKKLSEMSNKEIETLTRRLQLETSYSRLTAPTKSRGKQFIESALQTVGKKVASEFNKQFVEPRVEQLMTKLLARAAGSR